MLNEISQHPIGDFLYKIGTFSTIQECNFRNFQIEKITNFLSHQRNQESSFLSDILYMRLIKLIRFQQQELLELSIDEMENSKTTILKFLKLKEKILSEKILSRFVFYGSYQNQLDSYSIPQKLRAV